MINGNKRKTVFALVALVCLFATKDSAAACQSENVLLKVNQYGLWMKPDGPKCLYVSDLANVDTTFSIKVRTPGEYELRDGQITVRNAPSKFLNGQEVECSPDLELSSEFTNVGEEDVEVRVVGTNVPSGATICYEVVVDEVGMLDPRAQVDDNSALRSNISAELAELIDAYDQLIESSLGDSLSGTSLDEFVRQNYGMSESEARDLVGPYAKE